MSCRLVIFVVGVWMAACRPSVAQWTVQSFGTGVLTNVFEVKVGNARNDGTNRVYVTERNGRVMEWTYTGTGWTNTLVARGVTNLALLTIGAVRGDGTNRLYFTEYKTNGALHEAWWTGSGWSTGVVDATHQSFCLFSGAGRNDGATHLYVGTYGDAVHSGQGLWEYTNATGVWSKLCLHTNGMDGCGAVGDLRNDGTNRVLANTSVLDAYTWAGTNYTAAAIDHRAGLGPDPTDIGKVHNDGLTCIVANTGTGRLEYVRTGGMWVTNRIDVTGKRGDILVARLKSDGLRRIYSTYTSAKGPVREFTWDAGSATYRTSIVVDATSGATAKLAAGDGHNDGVARLYAPNYAGGCILEITSTNPFVYPVPRSDLSLAGVGRANGNPVLTITNLTAACDYTVESLPDFPGNWSNVAVFTASAALTNWVDTRAPGRAFYRAAGRPGEPR